jgi:hypothetical protein
MKTIRIAFVCLVAMLQACATWAPGKDPAGRALIAEANTVLVALQAYQAQNGKLPESLTELTPKYIAKLPEKPEIWYAPKTGMLTFHYSPTLGLGQCVCVAEPVSVSFGCGFCYV